MRKTAARNLLHSLLLALSLACGQAMGRGEPATILPLDRETQEALRVTALRHPEFLAGKGFERIGEFRLSAFLSEAREVRFAGTPDHLNTQGRFGYRYDVPTKTAILSLPGLKGYDPEEQQILMLHEVLGALGYHDEVYEISSTIVALSYLVQRAAAPVPALIQLATRLPISAARRTTNPTDTFRELEGLQKIQLEHKRIQMAGGGGGGGRGGRASGRTGGGVSEGGGGGDPVGAIFKVYLLYRLFSKPTPAHVLKFAINRFDIEISETLSHPSRPYPVCPYDQETFANFKRIEWKNGILVLVVPADCRGGGPIRQRIDLIEALVKENAGNG